MSSLSIVQNLFEPVEEYREKKIFRAAHDKNNPFTIISNKLLRDTKIKHSDRGLMVQLLSWSDYHNVCIQALVKRSIEGRDAIRGMLDRLIEAGYIRKFQKKGIDGRFDEVVYQLFEESTGTLILDLGGIEELEGEHKQLDLFECEINIMSESSSNDDLSVNGKAESGKADTNNNYNLINTNLNKNNNKENSVVQKETKQSLLNKWRLDLSDSQVKARLGIAGLSTFIKTQEELDRYLIDFNQQHEKYKNLSDTQRLKNFTAYLVRVKHTPIEYSKHIARMKALGIDLISPKKHKQKGIDENINPFSVKTSDLKDPPKLSISIDGF